MRLLPLLGALAALWAPASAQAPAPTFIENGGQLDGAVRYVLRLPGMAAFLTADGMRLRLDPRDGSTSGANLFLSFEGARSDVVLSGEGELAGRVNVYRQGKAFTGLSTFAGVHYAGLYPGVDLNVHARDGRLEYDLVLAPGADPAAVVLRVAGADGARLAVGGLVLDTPAGTLQHVVPATWEEVEGGARRPLACGMHLLEPDGLDVRLGFAVSGRDMRRRLVIDPVLVWSTFLGATLDDAALDVALHSDGTATVVGWTRSPIFPTTPGAFDTTANGSQDAFVSRLTADGSALVFSTYLGGAGTDIADAVALDAAGNVGVSGMTLSTDFPATIGAFDTVLDGGFLASDGFLAVLDGTGALQYATYVGGSGSDQCFDVAPVGGGRWCATGLTSSVDFVTTTGAYDILPDGGSGDAFVVLIDPLGGGLSDLAYGSFLGGSDLDLIHGVAVEASGDLLLTGHTISADFPVTAGAFDSSVAVGLGDAFVARLTPGGLGAADLVWATYLGGSGADHGQDIAVDATGTTWVAGHTVSTDFPVTVGSYDPTFNGDQDAFLACLSPGGTALVYGLYYGGTGADQALSLAVDATGSAHLAGWTTSTDLRTTPGAYQEGYGGGDSDMFLARFDAAGQGLRYATYFGASTADFGGGLDLDASGRVALAGLTDSQDFPFTPGVLDESQTFFTMDGFVATFELPSSPWSLQDYAKEGAGGLVPKLSPTGSLVAGTPGAFTLSDALPNALSFFLLDFTPVYAPFKGGTLVPGLFFGPISLPVLPDGGFPLAWSAWPAGLPAGFQLYFQWWVKDPGAPAGFSATNSVVATMP